MKKNKAKDKPQVKKGYKKNGEWAEGADLEEWIQQEGNKQQKNTAMGKKGQQIQNMVNQKE